MKHAGKSIMNERKNKMKKVDLNSKEIQEKAHNLQQECIDSLENNNVYISHFIEIDVLEKLNYCTKEQRWTDDGKEQIEKLRANIQEEIEKVVAKALSDNKNTCLLKFKSGTKDFKSIARASMSMSKIGHLGDMFNGMDIERLEELKNILD